MIEATGDERRLVKPTSIIVYFIILNYTLCSCSKEERATAPRIAAKKFKLNYCIVLCNIT